MDPIWILLAFALGLLVRQIGLPPLVGFLTAGFVLNACGAQGGETIDRIADWGVYLLLFTIGLKLNLRSLARPQIWAVASLHMLVTVLVFTAGLWILGAAGMSLLDRLDLKLGLLIAFALSFSSTVFAVKILEEKGEMNSLHGRISIGILIMQDLFAIVFMTLSTGKYPSPWALALLLLPLARPLFLWLMTRSGHGELLVLLGLLFSIGAAHLFQGVGMKPDLGPLLLGVIVGSHPKASEMATTLLGFKDLFLTGFFLNIGLAAGISWQSVWLALLLVCLVPLKVALFFWFLARFKLRARTSFITSMSLANYSEFGLIVGAVGVGSGWIEAEWLVVIALALSMTFVLAAPLNAAGHKLCDRWEDVLKRFEQSELLAEERPVDLGEVAIVVCGMGRIGTSAYDEMRKIHGDLVLGIDFDEARVAAHRQAGRQVILGDPTDLHFRQRLQSRGTIRWVLLAMPNHRENIEVVKILLEAGYAGRVAAIAQHDDQVAELKMAGAHAAFNFYAEAGLGFTRHVCEVFPGNPPVSTRS